MTDVSVTALHSFLCGNPDGTDTCARCRLPYEDTVHFQNYDDMVARQVTSDPDLCQCGEHDWEQPCPYWCGLHGFRWCDECPEVT